MNALGLSYTFRLLFLCIYDNCWRKWSQHNAHEIWKNASQLNEDGFKMFPCVESVSSMNLYAGFIKHKKCVLSVILLVI